MLITQRARMHGGDRPSIECSPTISLFIALLALALLASTAGAQSPDAPAPSVTELKARAYDAQQAREEAEKARAEAESAASEAEQAATTATRQADDAQRALQAAGATTTPVIVPAGPPAPAPQAAAPVPQASASDPELAASRAELDRATEEARNAAAAARAATRALEEHMKEREDRYARKGFFLAGGVLWAPNLFDTILSVDNSRGAWGGMGYRFTRRFEADVRFEWLERFDVGGFNTIGSVDGWSATANGRFFLLTKAFQPYLGVGLGAMQARTRLSEVGGPGRLERTDTVPTFRASGGFDYYISESFALTADGAVNLPGGDLSSLTYGTVSGGIKLRF